MKSPLFWKILIGFWLTFMVVNQGNALLYQLFSDEPSYTRAFAEDIAPVILGASKAAVELGGAEAFNHLRKSWPEWQLQAIDIEPFDPNVTYSVDPDVITTIASDREGRQWLMYVVLPTPDREWSLSEAFRPPSDLLWMSTIGALFFSAALAFYLTRPVHHLRSGFRALAAGDLTTRLQPTIGRRRDEIADLAADFDQMAARLQQLVQVRDQLLHDVSHELRSPLARLSQAIALARQHPANLDASLSRIEMEVRRLDELVGELLSLARAESGEAGRDQYFDLAALVQSTAKNAEFEATANGVSVRVLMPPGEQSIVRGNVELMRRAVENVVRNALHVSAAGQSVEVAMTTDMRAQQFVLTVADSGPGVEDGKLHQMFDPFVRLDDGSARKGYGLGLAIARRAVVALGGSIGAQNRLPGGLVVTMRLPIHPFSGAD